MPTLTGAKVPHMPDSPPTSETGTIYGYPKLGATGRHFSTIADSGSKSSGTAGGTTVLKYLNPFHWFGKTITYTNETRWFNDFRLARVPARDKKEAEDTDTGRTRERNEGGWCWTEKEVRRTHYQTLAYSEEQRFEVWTINRTKESYFGFLTGTGGTTIDASIDGTAAIQAAGGKALQGMAAEAGATTAGAELSSAAAATSASAEAFGLVGWGFLVFQVTTGAWVFFSGGATNAAGDKSSEGWAVFRQLWGPRQRVSEETVWVMVGTRRPCPQAEAGGGGRVRTGEHATPVPAGGTGDGGTLAPGGRRLMPGQSVMTIGLLILVAVMLLGAALMLTRGGSESAVPASPGDQASAAATAAAATENSGGGMQLTEPPSLVIPAAGPLTSLWDALLNGELVPADSAPSYTEAQAAWANGFKEAMRQIVLGPTVSSFPSDVVPPQEPNRPETALSELGAGFAKLSDDARMRVFMNTVFPCGEGDFGFTLCPDPMGSSPGGEHVVVVAQFQGALNPTQVEAGSLYQYGFVFDADGIAENNYRAAPAFPNDFFDNTDRWYVVSYQPASGWTLQASQMTNGTATPVASAARVIMMDELMVLVVPASEFEISNPPYRVTAFWHTGDYGQAPPHVWSGDVEPAVGQPLSTDYFEEPLPIER